MFVTGGDRTITFGGGGGGTYPDFPPLLLKLAACAVIAVTSKPHNALMAEIRIILLTIRGRADDKYFSKFRGLILRIG